MSPMLGFEQFIGLAIFVIYFLSIFFLFLLIVQSISERRRALGSVSWSHIGLALASFAHTWYYMLSFMQWSFVEYERNALGGSTEPTLVRVANWLANTALFEQAWTTVCNGPLKWWWSEQLCLFTVGFWTVFLSTKGREFQVRHLWAYMVLGQLVAISVGMNLFFFALPPTARAAVFSTRERTVPPLLWLSVLASLATVLLVPHSLRHDYFLSNLLVMHALLVIPLLPINVGRTGRLHIRTRTLYQLVTLLAVTARLGTTMGIVGGPGMVWAVLKSHPAQASIGWDVLWTTISFLMWVRPGTSTVRRQLTVTVTLALASVFGSIGTSAPLYFWFVDT
ncbi:hypothetical protein F5148DRAFT_1215842 [Russula earlei]|uniref:Uncharacterized protein n=1 Tax=Russula earlei TaxID=71964 RepID=A0ACC0U5R3_9AGAM|nr:hypothetical protein F5148DRAFT_1215842 [Russula earlei]